MQEPHFYSHLVPQLARKGFEDLLQCPINEHLLLILHFPR
jgi:hypothetical protein